MESPANIILGGGVKGWGRGGGVKEVQKICFLNLLNRLKPSCIARNFMNIDTNTVYTECYLYRQIQYNRSNMADDRYFEETFTMRFCRKSGFMCEIAQ